MLRFLYTFFSVLLFAQSAFAQCPQITSILVDACNASEGRNEFFTFQNGNTALSLNDIRITFPSIASAYCNTSCTTSTLVNHATHLNSLNTAAGCAGLFVFSTTIPANAKTIVFTGNPPTAVYDFSTLCGSGPYYVIYTNNPADGTGRFANNGTGLRTLSVQFSAACTDEVTYNRALVSSTDGAYVSFTDNGTASYSVLHDCASPAVLLPLLLTRFEVSQGETELLLEWQTEEEYLNNSMKIERSADGLHFSVLTALPGNRETQKRSSSYFFADTAPLTGLNYYRIAWQNHAHQWVYSKTVACRFNGSIKPKITARLDQDGEHISLHLSHPLHGSVQVNVLTLQGGRVAAYTFEGTDKLKIDKDLLLPNRIYLLQIHVGGHWWTEKIGVIH